MPYPASGVMEYGVRVGGAVGPADYFAPQPSDAPVIGPPIITGADATLTFDGRDSVIFRWAGPQDPAFVDHLFNLWEGAQGAAGRAQVRYYSDRAGAFIEERGVPRLPTYRARAGWWVWDLEWIIEGLGLT
jgi:hypothetical protein